MRIVDFLVVTVLALASGFAYSFVCQKFGIVNGATNGLLLFMLPGVVALTASCLLNLLEAGESC